MQLLWKSIWMDSLVHWREWPEEDDLLGKFLLLLFPSNHYSIFLSLFVLPFSPSLFPSFLSSKIFPQK